MIILVSLSSFVIKTIKKKLLSVTCIRDLFKKKREFLNFTGFRESDCQILDLKTKIAELIKTRLTLAGATDKLNNTADNFITPQGHVYQHNKKN